MKVLITGFDPFEGESLNPAYEAVKLLPNEIAGAEIIKLEIPTVFGKSLACVEAEIIAKKPDIVICVGQAGGRFEVCPERIAINVDDARIKDNEGNQPKDVPVFEDGPAAYFSTLPVKDIILEIKKNGIPAKISESAGTFVCNHVFYGLLYLLDKKYPNTTGGFVHVPYIHSQALDKKNTPSLSLNDIVMALEATVKVCVESAKKNV